MNEELRVLYEDEFLVVCVKPVGVLSEDDPQRACMPQLLRRHYRKTGQPDYIATVHRLDKITGGVMLFSRRREITGKLIAAVAAHQVEKEYLAVLRGHPLQPEDTLTDLLFRDSRCNKSFVVQRMRKGVREASLSYRELGQNGELSLVRVRLHTGRTHQIRCQMAYAGHPLLGDDKYGSKEWNRDKKERRQLLCSYKTTFDFGEEGGALSYLSGKTIRLSCVPFVEKYFKGVEI